jgi:hypothetical protein
MEKIEKEILRIEELRNERHEAMKTIPPIETVRHRSRRSIQPFHAADGSPAQKHSNVIPLPPIKPEGHREIKNMHRRPKHFDRGVVHRRSTSGSGRGEPLLCIEATHSAIHV